MNLEDAAEIQGDLFAEKSDRQYRLEKAILDINKGS